MLDVQGTINREVQQVKRDVERGNITYAFGLRVLVNDLGLSVVDADAALSK